MVHAMSSFEHLPSAPLSLWLCISSHVSAGCALPFFRHLTDSTGNFATAMAASVAAAAAVAKKLQAKRERRQRRRQRWRAKVAAAKRAASTAPVAAATAQPTCMMPSPQPAESHM
jgi:hypothetical protein